MTTVVHPRLAARRSGRAARWWGRAWERAVEEAAYDRGEVRRALVMARGGDVGAIAVDAGSAAATVRSRRHLEETVGVRVRLPPLDLRARALLAELVAAAAGRVTDLLAGDLPIDLVEQAEDAGVELLPYGGELDCDCDCDHWVDPCEHALALLTQLGWLLDADPFVLLALRGVDRETLLADLHAGRPDEAGQEDEVALELGEDAARRAAAALRALDDGDPDALDALLR